MLKPSIKLRERQSKMHAQERMKLLQLKRRLKRRKHPQLRLPMKPKNEKQKLCPPLRFTSGLVSDMIYML